MRTISVIKLFILDTSAFCLETCVANLVRQIADAVLVFFTVLAALYSFCEVRFGLSNVKADSSE